MNKQNLQIVLYSVAYGTNFMYALILGMLGYYLDIDINLVVYALLFLIPVTVTLVLSIPYVRQILLEADDSKDLPTLQSKAIIRLAIYHVPTLIGVVAALTYLFVF